MDEDLKIIEYIKNHARERLKPGYIKYWMKAIDREGFLNGSRKADSLRKRYNLFLCHLNEKDLAQIDKWVKKYGRLGRLVFKEEQHIGSTEIKYTRNMFNEILSVKVCKPKQRLSSIMKNSNKEEQAQKAIRKIISKPRS